MITGIRMENFKGIERGVSLELCPITLLFGANSAGKSTVLHALLYLREIFERGNLSPDKTIDGGDCIDLGGFASLVHGKNNQEAISIGIELLVDEDWPQVATASFFSEEIPELDELIGTPSKVVIRLSIAWSELENGPYVSLCELDFDGREVFVTRKQSGRKGVELSINVTHPLMSSLISDENLSNAIGYQFDDTSLAPESITSLGAILAGESLEDLRNPESLSEPFWWSTEIEQPDAFFGLESLYLSPCTSLGDEQADEYLSYSLQNALGNIFEAPFKYARKALSQFRYLGPIREVPLRQHQPPQITNRSRWADGLGAWDLLHTGDDSLIEKVSEWFSSQDKLDAGYQIERKSFVEIDMAHPIIRKLYDRRAFDDVDLDQDLDLSELPVQKRVVIVPNGSEVEMLPHDLGVGISQIVPVIVSALEGSNRLICIEQPELHLHPRIQARLADLFIHAIHSNKHRFIIETHSEHLILRLLRRIRETTSKNTKPEYPLLNEHLAVYYMQQTNSATQATKIDVDQNGEFVQPWPDDFFEVDFFERFPDAR